MRRIATILFDGLNALDATGPLETFAAVRTEDGKAAYAFSYWSIDGDLVESESGLRVSADPIPPTAPQCDLLIVPGGAGLREPTRLAQVATWLRDNEQQFHRIASVCTGAYAMAESGLWNGREATTHWRFARDLAARYPLVNVVPDALFLNDGKFFSSGGVTAGVDLALAIIELDHGPRAATAAARELVVFLQRTGRQSQFSEPLRLQAAAPDNLSAACVWAANNLSGDLSVRHLAQRAGLSERQFSRAFVNSFGVSPAHYVARLRLDSAREALTQPPATVDQVARLIGFKSPDGFRRAFERQFGISPSEYQHRFAPARERT